MAMSADHRFKFDGDVCIWDKNPQAKKKPKQTKNKNKKKTNKQTKKKQRMISEMIIPKLGFSMDEIKHLTNQTLFDFFH